MGIDTRKFYWNVQAKGFLLDVVSVESRSIEDGVNNTTSGLDRHALAGTVRSAAPARVYEPSLATVCVELLLEKICVSSRVEGEECGAEAGREIGRRLDDASLGTSDLGGVARDEVIHCLARSQLGNWWQDTKGIACEENNVFGMPRHLWLVISIDMEDWVGNTAILGFGHIEVVRHELAILVVQFDILEKSIGVNGSVNIRLCFLGEVDSLGIAATLKVENSIIVPAMLVVADESSLGIG